MKKGLWIVLLIIAIALTAYIISTARAKNSLPKPEDVTGKDASAFLPKETKPDKPSAKGSENMKVSGPVWVEE